MKSISIYGALKRRKLIGSQMGLYDLPKLSVAIGGAGDSSVVLVDWGGIEIATASYLKAGFLPLFSLVKRTALVSIGLTPPNLEELELALQTEDRAVWIVEGRKEGQKASILGSLDQAYSDTLKMLSRSSSSTAGELCGEARSPIGRTAWINRLNTLHSMGLISRERIGKEYSYSLFPI